VTNRSDEVDPPRDRTFMALLALMATGVVCATYLCALPRPAPLELPVLNLDEAKARRQIEVDEGLATEAQDELSKAMYQALRASGKLELEPHDRRAYELEQRILALSKRAHRELGNKGLLAVRAYATQRSMLALFAQLDDEQEERELIGVQRNMFAAYGYMTKEGRLLAPALTVRTMFKVRWNMIFGEPVTAGLSQIELFAYEGFRALEVDDMPADMRFAALYELIRAGGGLSAERALAILQAAGGKAGPLIARVQNSEQESRLLRLRNMALAEQARMR
jgi:hypothetical protein